MGTTEAAAARLDGQVAWVTGSGSGLGRAIAARLAGDGARVLVSDVNTEGAEATVALIGDAGGEARAVACDVTDLSQCDAAVAAAEDAWGRLDHVVANAGIVGFGPVEMLDESEWDRVLEVNLMGVFRTAKASIPALRRAGGGSMVFLSSVEGLVGNAMLPAYAAAKTGLLGLCRSLAAEGALSGIRVNCVNPGFTRSPMTDPLEEAFGIGAHMASITPMGRVGEPTDVASVVAFLCSEDAGYVTAQWLAIDGGMTSVR